MAVTTHSQPRAPVLGQLVIALLIVAFVVAMVIVGQAVGGHRRHRATSVPSAGRSAFLGTANSGPDDPAVGISSGLGETAGALGGGHPGASPEAATSTCATVVPRTHLC
jgi:hypothetical protein